MHHLNMVIHRCFMSCVCNRCELPFMVSEYKGSATKRLSTIMPIVVVALVLAVVHKYTIRCNTEDFAVKPSMKKRF